MRDKVIAQEDSFELSRLDKIKAYLSKIKSEKNFDSQKLETKSFLDKICVSPPYFAFKDIYKFDNYLIAPVTLEQIMGFESSSITIGEAGRHFAILGSCACSMSELQKKYYLVEKVHIRNEIQNFVKKGTTSYVVVRSSFDSKRIAGANGWLFNDELELNYSINLSYYKLSLEVFGKIFKRFYSDTSRFTGNPYKNYYDLEMLSENADGLTLTLNNNDNNICFGHFEGFPSIPTAYLVYNIIHKCSDLILKKYNSENYIVEYANLDLKKLLFPKCTKIINVTYETKFNRTIFQVTILQDQEIASLVNFSILTKA